MLQREARHFVAAVLDVVDGLVEQHLVGLLGVLGDRVFVLLVVERARRTASQRRARDQQPDDRNIRFEIHTSTRKLYNLYSDRQSVPGDRAASRALSPPDHSCEISDDPATTQSHPARTTSANVFQMIPRHRSRWETAIRVPSASASSVRTLSQRIGNELLAAEPRIHAHDQHVIRHVQTSSSIATGVAGIQHHAGLRALAPGSSAASGPDAGRLPDGPRPGRRRPR